MLIQNKLNLLNQRTRNALEIIEAGLDAARPANSLGRIITNGKILIGKKSLVISKYDRVYVVAVGKAADSMTEFVRSKIKVDGGIVVIPQSYRSVLRSKKLATIRSGHPIPDQASVRAAKSIISLLESAKKRDLVLFLVSGGTSALVSMPYSITLRQKQRITEELLKCGASINEVNAVRKHLSHVKGGRILEHLRCDAISLVMSDVVGDDLSSIGSGFTYCDRSSFADCMKIIRKYRLQQRIPDAALAVLRDGMAGKVPETPKTPKIRNIVVATNADCLDAMKKTAKKLGFHTTCLSQLDGNVVSAANKIISSFSFKKKHCLVFGGETTVVVRGDGKGGRNQEIVLQILYKTRKSAVIASVGTDGIDGNTVHAGAICATNLVRNEISKYLKNNDSNSFFKKHGGLILTGPTHTNLMDLGLILAE